LNKRLTLKIAKDLGIPKAEITRIDNSFAMEAMAREIDLGKSPTSNTQLVKHMQAVLDELCPGLGKVNGHDVKYALYASSKRKGLGKVSTAKHTALLAVLTDVFHRVAVNGVYSVDYKTVKGASGAESSTTVAAAAEPAK